MKINNQVISLFKSDFFIKEDDIVFLVYEICSKLNYKKLIDSYAKKGRPPALPLNIMFMLVVYAYINGIYSSRKIEYACKTHICFLYLLQQYEAPSKSTINRFRYEHAEEFQDLFNQFISELKEREEISCENIFIDGTKIEANANRYSFVWGKAVAKNKTKLENKAESYLTELREEYSQSFSSIVEALEYLSARIDKAEIKFVHGRGKHKTQLQRDYEKCEEILAKSSQYAEYQEILGDRNSFSKTDHDATFMRMKDDHMKNGQLKAGYNIQIGVDSEYIVSMDVYQDRNDVTTFIPFMETTKENLGFTYPNATTDAGYESEENYVYMAKNKQASYVKPQNYEQTKKRKTKHPYAKYNFEYNEEADTFTCPAGETLVLRATKKSKSVTGYESKKGIYYTEKCQQCPHRDKCTKSKDGIRKLEHSKLFHKYRQRSLKNITSEKGIVLRMNRSIQVEGAFGVLKEDYGFRRFLTRGKKNVKTEMLFHCFAYNFKKYHNKIAQKRTKTYLFEKKKANEKLTA